MSGSSATFSSIVPFGRSTREASARNSTVVSSAGTRPPAYASSTNTSALASASWATPVRPSTGRTRIRCRRGRGSSRRTSSVSSTLGSRTICGDPGRAALTYRASVIAAPPIWVTRSGPDPRVSMTAAKWAMYSKPRLAGSARLTWDWGLPSIITVTPPRPSSSGTSSIRLAGSFGTPTSLGGDLSYLPVRDPLVVCGRGCRSPTPVRAGLTPPCRWRESDRILAPQACGHGLPRRDVVFLLKPSRARAAKPAPGHGMLSGVQHRLDGATLIHRRVTFGHLVQRQVEGADQTGVDRPGEHLVAQGREVLANRRHTPGDPDVAVEHVPHGQLDPVRRADIANGGARACNGDGGGHRLAGTHALQHGVGPDAAGELQDGRLTRLTSLGDDIGGTQRPGDLLAFLVPGHGHYPFGAHPCGGKHPREADSPVAHHHDRVALLNAGGHGCVPA